MPGTNTPYRIRTRLFAVVLPMLGHAAWAEADQPNILVLWGDDIGQFNISAYNGA